MQSSQIRQKFLQFFESKGHVIVSSAPIVVKNDPTLMFTNAGMNQFKDIFLGNEPAINKRIANTQTCLRVSGKHNDLDEVGHDTYHHTMFEMLGNWSFGDYFKKDAIDWAWELLTEIYNINKDDIYVTVFGGDEGDKIEPDEEAKAYWKNYLPESRIIYGSKKDNFWEMGDTGPCGPCSEIHIDIRNAHDKLSKPGRELVNNDHPQVIEIWNLVFIQFNRLSNGTLQALASKHIDTGMGFERLCMVLQGKQSNYDTDVFQPYIHKLSQMTGKIYGSDPMTDVAMRVISDHIRAVAFAIADGELPSNIRGGYVIRRILRRAVRYGYTFLGFRVPFMNELVPEIVSNMGAFFPALTAQENLIKRVIAEEESAFLKTLAIGIGRFEQYTELNPEPKIISGNFAFELFDTYGFPIDLTQIMASESGYIVDIKGFELEMAKQKERSRAAAITQKHDWTILRESDESTIFTGYDTLVSDVVPLRYRSVCTKGKTEFHLILDQTPFYAEAGGQAGDCGRLLADGIELNVVNTIKENNLIIHIIDKLPPVWPESFKALVDKNKRLLTENNHSATHLMHSALRKVLGNHVQQKGSLVDACRLRFDFAHFAKLTQDEITRIEELVNEKIRQNIRLEEHRSLSMEQAKSMGALALFGEKYGDTVRVISFDKNYSTELCGGTHVQSTGQIGLFRIVSEGAIAAGIRRIEAITGKEAEAYVNGKIKTLEQAEALLKNPKDFIKAITQLQSECNLLTKQLQDLRRQLAKNMAVGIIAKTRQIDNINFIGIKLDVDSLLAKDLAFEVKNQIDNLFLVISHVSGGDCGITVALSESLIHQRSMHAGSIVNQLAKEINGGGGGQPHFATAGGKNPNGLEKVILRAEDLLKLHKTIN